MKLIYCIMAAMIMTTAANAQEKDKEKDNSNKNSLVVGTDGIRLETKNKKTKHDRSIDVTFGMVDVGINTLQDNTNYSSIAAKSFLQVPANLQNSNLFDLRTGKSINVNIWPIMGKGRILKTSNQKIYLSTGIGLQIYNFRYSKGLEYINNPIPSIALDSITDYKKNKLVVTYLSIPLQFTFKTRMADKLWLVYGVGITGGYRISSYTKQVSTLYGKQRDNGNFNLNNFNSTINAEFGLDNYFRLYASYQLTNMYKDASGLDQHPFCIGLRFGGI